MAPLSSRAALLLVLAAPLVLPLPAPADTIGPVCWEMYVPPVTANEEATTGRFSLVFHTDSSSSTTAVVVGTARFPGGPTFDPPVSGSALLYGDLAAGVVSLGLTVAPTEGRGPMFINAHVPLLTLGGQGRCSGGSSVCGNGRNVVWLAMSCAAF
jgi:hypothetical protein